MHTCICHKIRLYQMKYKTKIIIKIRKQLLQKVTNPIEFLQFDMETIVKFTTNF